ADFEVTVEVNNYAPAEFTVRNLSAGGNSYQWTFEGGTPSAYTGEHPPTIIYEHEGQYRIKMETDNGSQTFTVIKEIEVGPRLQVAFDIVPSFEDEDDMEAPLRATFNTRLKGVETLSWTCPGAEITNETSETASIYFQKEGEYTVTLDVSNGKTSERVSQNITVQKNTNLRAHQDIRLGINTAGEKYPMYYSTRLRHAIKQQEINEENASLIDIIFFGLNMNFTKNCFVSPADLSNTTFPEIPKALQTKFINKTEMGSINITPSQFYDMTTDERIRNLPIASGKTGDNFFSDSLLPRVVLFETSDGRKGAILIKEMVRSEKENSYIVVDIKIQKND
ncbi:MAG: PKD domain-containing protein, partial [Tannerellaceae bacterium]|nr:PKD domain-containing protein [Tannerellaceae bacterium]